MAERNLLERLAAGPERALGRAYHLALRVTGNETLAEDAVQEACARLLRRPPSEQGRELPLAYFLQTVHSSAVSLLRSEEARRAREEDSPMQRQRSHEPPELSAERRELIAAARAELLKLPADLRVAVGLCCEQGLTQAEAAEIAGVPEGTMARRVQRGLEQLRERLGPAGFAGLAPVALAGAMSEAGFLDAPATLIAAVEKLVSGKAAVSGSAVPTAKGGLIMKLLAGIVVAGALAGGVALISSAGTQPAAPMSAPPAPAKGLTYEHYAFASWLADEMDGPRREAMGRGPGPIDEDFNCYVGGRVIRAEDGMVATVAGGMPEFGQDEGPAAFLPRLSPIRGTGYAQGVGGWLVVGLPLKGGDKGCIYAYSDTRIMRIWKNADKGGRWWAKIVAGPGKVEIPGGTVYQGQVWRKQGEKEYKAVFFTKGGFYVLEDAGGATKFNCLLSMDRVKDYLPPHSEGNRKAFPTLGCVDSGGNFYLGYYFSHGWKTGAAIQRVSPDGAKVEDWVTHSGAAKGTDGPGMKTGWHCGPHSAAPRDVSPWYPPGLFLSGAHDEHTLRRITPDGRLSTLYEDGEWREGTSYDLKNMVDGVSGFVYGANGWALGCAAGEGMSRKRGEGIYLIKGIDFTKPTVGK